MHQIHNTNAFIISSFKIGEANKILYCLTEHVGLIKVIAQGIRKEKSKLRNSVQDYSLAKISVVFGKSGWRLVNAEPVENYFHLLEKDEIAIVARIFSLIKRMIPEEETNPEIFYIVNKFMNHLREKKSAKYFLEILCVASILKNLGYIDDENLAFYQESDENTNILLKKINNALKESHL